MKKARVSKTAEVNLLMLSDLGIKIDGAEKTAVSANGKYGREPGTNLPSFSGLV